jgi:hypothetical protein
MIIKSDEEIDVSVDLQLYEIQEKSNQQIQENTTEDPPQDQQITSPESSLFTRKNILIFLFIIILLSFIYIYYFYTNTTTIITEDLTINLTPACPPCDQVAPIKSETSKNEFMDKIANPQPTLEQMGRSDNKGSTNSNDRPFGSKSDGDNSELLGGNIDKNQSGSTDQKISNTGYDLIKQSPRYLNHQRLFENNKNY